MSGTWTQERVLSLAPDSASASAAQGLLSPKKWSGLGRSGRAVWGLCQGSGKDPYQARVDLSEPAFKCSCPSRKFPCKHGLAVMLLFAKDEKAFKEGAEPGWVADWLAGRTERAEKKVERAKEAAEKPVDVEAQAKRTAARERRVADGLAECRVWLEDVARRGLAAVRGEPESFWERLAARLVDAQAPGLARHVRQIPGVMASGDGWHIRTLERLGRVHMLVAAGEKVDALPPDLGVDVRVALGRTQAKEEALAATGVADRWCVVGQIVEEEDRIKARRSWLLGRNTGRRALVLDFAAGLQPLDASLIAGTEFDGEVAYYPARTPLRAVVKARTGATAGITGAFKAAANIEEELGRFAGALAATPWLERWPLVLGGMTPTVKGERLVLVDATGRGVPVRPGFAAVWKLMAVSRGRPLTVMGEWDGEWVSPLSAFGGEGFEDLAPRWGT